MGYHMAVTDLHDGRHARGARPSPRAGSHLVQALHGLQGRAHGRRRDALPDDGGRRRDRRARHGARRERGRDRRAREAGARSGEHGAALPRADAPARDRGRGDEPRDPARPGRRARRCTSSTCRARRPSTRSHARGSRAGTSGARRARSTSSSTTRTSSGRTSRARSTSTRRRRARSRTRRCSGTRCARTSSPSISTDHCAFLWDGQKSLGKDDFSKIPNGGPGLENRLHMIHEFGVRTGRISLNRMVELLATNPAKLFGLYPRKGTIAPGSDADIVVFDPEKRHLITAATQHSKTDYNLYEGTEVTGSPEIVMLRGTVLVDAGELVGGARCRPVRRARRVRAGAPARRSPLDASCAEGAGHLPPCPAPSAQCSQVSRTADRRRRRSSRPLRRG